LVNALKRVDYPTLGNPTIPHLNPISYFQIFIIGLKNHNIENRQNIPKLKAIKKPRKNGASTNHDGR